jgi:hypothetical protein
VAANPEPDELITFLDGQRAEMNANARRPETPDFLEV